MIASAVLLAIVAAAAVAVGRYGRANAQELVGLVGDPDVRVRRYRSIQRGSLATIGVGYLLAAAAAVSLVAGLFGA